MGLRKNKSILDQAGTTVSEYVEQVKPQLEAAVATAREKAGPALADARDKAGPAIADAKAKAAPYLADARDKAAPYLADARDKAAPVLADARDKAAPVLAEARERLSTEVLPVVTAAIAALDTVTEDARAETLRRGKAVAAALKGEVEVPEKSHRVRNLIIALGLGGLVFALAKRFKGGEPTTSWQSSYTPPPTSTPGPVPASGAAAGAAAGAEATDDTAASDPAEAAADATEVPHQPTTPDNPVTEIDVDKA